MNKRQVTPMGFMGQIDPAGAPQGFLGHIDPIGIQGTTDPNGFQGGFDPKGGPLPITLSAIAAIDPIGQALPVVWAIIGATDPNGSFLPATLGVAGGIDPNAASPLQEPGGSKIDLIPTVEPNGMGPYIVPSGFTPPTPANDHRAAIPSLEPIGLRRAA